ncbi:phage antirepressor KilAC domain-containing protein, partial [Oribacterium sinus]
TTNEVGEPTVLGRELHEFLGVTTRYNDWFPRMVEYGFTEGKDFNLLKNEQVRFEGNREVTRELIDHLLTIDMAKEICMIQRTEVGKQARQYFIQVEKDYNSPEKIMARALRIAEKELSTLKLENKVQAQQIAELQPKATYYDLILQCPSLLSVTEIAKDYGLSAKGLNKILHEQGVQFNQSGVWFLYSKYQDKGYTSTKTQNYNRPDGTQGSRVHTYWTQKGRIFLYGLLKEIGYLPLIERFKEDIA